MECPASNAKLPPAMRLPLSGITVLSLEQAIAAPLGSRHLANWGARVIKIKRPDGGDFPPFRAGDGETIFSGTASRIFFIIRSCTRGTGFARSQARPARRRHSSLLSPYPAWSL